MSKTGIKRGRGKLIFILPAEFCSFLEAHFQFNVYTNTFCISSATHTHTCPIYSNAYTHIKNLNYSNNHFVPISDEKAALAATYT